MVSGVFSVSGVIGRWFKAQSGQVKPKIIELIFAAFPLRMQLQLVRTKLGRIEINVMCSCASTCLHVNCCFGEATQ